MSRSTQSRVTNAQPATQEVRGQAKDSKGVNPEEVALIAYELFERRGKEHGHDREDWLEAERIIQTRRRRTR